MLSLRVCNSDNYSIDSQQMLAVSIFLALIFNHMITWGSCWWLWQRIIHKLLTLSRSLESYFTVMCWQHLFFSKIPCTVWKSKDTCFSSHKNNHSGQDIKIIHTFLMNKKELEIIFLCKSYLSVLLILSFLSSCQIFIFPSTLISNSAVSKL